jgi:hypothetical protein
MRLTRAFARTSLLAHLIYWGYTMSPKNRSALVAIVAATLVVSMTDVSARVTQIVIDRVESVFDGESFGEAGPYEKVVGRAFGEVNPNDPRNSIIVNLDKAPRNADGMVEYEVDIYFLKPVDLSKGNRRIYYNVLNRGNKQIIANWHDPVGANANEPTTLNDAGNGFLMRYGYTILFSAWQGDVAAGNSRMLAHFPIATNPDGSPIIATNREEYIFNNTTNPATAALSYPAATLDPTLASLSVRQNAGDPRQMPADLSWTYLDERRIQINRPAGFDAGAIYEFIYEARDPVVMGLGFAAMRDVVSFVRRQASDDEGNPNPLNDEAGQPAVDYVLAFGSSQAGRYLRDFLWQGFNEDEAGWTVFDGMIPHKPGSRKTFTNFLWGQPGRFSRQHEEHDFMQTGDQFPFTYETRTDPISGLTDGLLVRCRASDTCPKIMQTDSATEYWGARASLVTTDEFGQQDIALPEIVRHYLFSSTQHGPTSNPSFGICQQLSNPLPFSQAQRALAIALDLWVTEGIDPPPSRSPRIADGTLVPSLPQASQGFPDIPGVRYTGTVNELAILDLTVVPPVPIPGADYTVLVPKTDTDGNDLAGIRHPTLAAPLATHTGWNLRRAGFAEDQGCSLTGTYVPFAQSRMERLETGDPRPSIDERYRNHGAYVSLIARAVGASVRERVLLEEDAERIMDAAAHSSIGKPSRGKPRR